MYDVYIYNRYYLHKITYRYKYLRNDSITCYLLQRLLDYELAHCGPLISQSSSWLMVAKLPARYPQQFGAGR